MVGLFPVTFAVSLPCPSSVTVTVIVLSASSYVQPVRAVFVSLTLKLNTPAFVNSISPNVTSLLVPLAIVPVVVFVTAVVIVPSGLFASGVSVKV